VSPRPAPSLRARAAAWFDRPDVRRLRAWVLLRRRKILAATLATGIVAMVVHWS
jgi:uncharacterized protein involved in exopolysaccharide biosynthesis